MDILNLAAAALIDAFKRNDLNPELLVEGTGLTLEKLRKTNKKHSWNQFVKMYENCAQVMGPFKTTREIAYTGIYNDELSTTRKAATCFLDTKCAYWYLALFASRKLFKGAVQFKYQKLGRNFLTMEITVNPELKSCPLLLETYIYLFENLPTVLGLPKANVTAEISSHHGFYRVELKETSYFKLMAKNFLKIVEGYKSFIVLLGEMEDQSVELSKMIEAKSQIIRMLSHDIANQIMILDSNIQKVLRRNRIEEEDLNCLEAAKNSSQKLRHILLNVRNMEISDIKGLTLGPVNIDVIFHSIAQTFSEQLKAKNIKLFCKNELPANITALAEKTSLEINVLGNLVSNAIKFSESGTVITLEAHHLEGKVQIIVSDEGKGFTCEERNQLFSKNISESSEGTKGEAGTGLGLTIVNTYVLYYEGKISVQANYPKGSIFCIELHPTPVQRHIDSEENAPHILQ